jgi:hypothetical protein
MAETVNLCKMAEKLSQEVFAEFRWQRIGAMNLNWPCEDEAKHKVKTHPSDVVFFYDEPYSQARTYVNVDLKSYAKGTITVSNVRSAIESLAKSISCAEKSGEWRKQFIHDHVSPEICGMLFVYNHDGEYDKDFFALLDQVQADKLDIPKGSKIVVLGPNDIFWLNNVRHEIAYMRGGTGDLPDRDNCHFFHPHLVRKKNIQQESSSAATLEMLTAPWIVLAFTHPQKNNLRGYVVFLRRHGESVDEFLYLIDYLMHYQMLVENCKIYIKALAPDSHAVAYFDKAKSQYAEEVGGGGEIKKLLDSISFGQINDVTTKFSETELGMG